MAQEPEGEACNVKRHIAVQAKEILTIRAYSDVPTAQEEVSVEISFIFNYR